MKILVKYNDTLYLVGVKEDREIDYDQIFHTINEGRWPDECHDKEWIVERSKIIACFTDESTLIS